jgi:hypothetical protein
MEVNNRMKNSLDFEDSFGSKCVMYFKGMNSLGLTPYD